MKVLAEVFRIPSSTEILIQIAESKLQFAIHFTKEPIIKNDEDGIQTHPRRAQWINSPSPLPLGHFDHNIYEQTVFLFVNFKSTNFHFLLILQFSIFKNIFTWSCQDFLLSSLSCVPITQKDPVSSPGRIT